MSLPNAERVQRAVSATWPEASFRKEGVVTYRDGAGGGKRVSATTVDGTPDRGTVEQAAAAMRARGERPLFLVRDGETALDRHLSDLGFGVIDPVVFYAAPVDHLIEPNQPRLAAIACDAPLAILREIWAEAGIGPARLAVMERVAGPKRYLLGRAGDRPAGVAFAALDGDLAMIHAIEVRNRHRRMGVGRALIRKAAAWARAQGAANLALIVVAQNGPARALYASLGMEEVGQYHYRIAPEEEGG